MSRLEAERRQVGLGEVAVVLGELLAALGEGPLLGVRPATSLLRDLPARLQHLGLPLQLVLDSPVQRAEGVDVLELRFDAQLARARRPD